MVFNLLVNKQPLSPFLYSVTLRMIINHEASGFDFNRFDEWSDIEMVIGQVNTRVQRAAMEKQDSDMCRQTFGIVF